MELHHRKWNRSDVQQVTTSVEGSSLIPPAITICHMEKVTLPLKSSQTVVKDHQYGAAHISCNCATPDGEWEGVYSQSRSPTHLLLKVTSTIHIPQACQLGDPDSVFLIDYNITFRGWGVVKAFYNITNLNGKRKVKILFSLKQNDWSYFLWCHRYAFCHEIVKKTKLQ